jgi:serine protease DegQ
MIYRLWLIFCQTATVCLAALFVLGTLRPDIVSLTRGQVVTVREASPQTDAPPVGSYRAAAQRAMPAVVNIYTSKEVSTPRHPFMDDPVFKHFFGEKFDARTTRRTTNLGSGVIVSAEGHILTNGHVIEAADEIEVALADTRRARARVVGIDAETDLAVLKIDLRKLPSILFGRSDQIGVGDVVLAIGNPFGVGQTVTFGIVSAVGRSHLGINTFENFIQTDAAINPGNSGGALIDTSGRLIGINTAIYSRTPGGASLGIGFAIPASTARQVLEQIIESGQVTRGWIGVGVQDMTRELAQSFRLPDIRGALITEVFHGTPAEKAGVKLGDILIEVDGRAIADSAGMLNLVSSLRPGLKTTLKVVRNQQETVLTVVVGRRPGKEPVER